MKVFIYISIFLFYGLTSFAQKLKTDTIDYSCFKLFNKPWNLYKVLEGKNEITKFDSQIGYMEFCPASYVINFGKKWQPEITETDTIMMEQWDLDNLKQRLEGHVFARVKLNKSNNIMIIEKSCSYNTPIKPFTGKFKILKWTKSEVILLDLGNIQKFRRIYYFNTK